MRSSRNDPPPLGGSSFPSPPPRSPGRANLANTALPSPAGLRPASRLNQNLAESGIPLRFGPSAGRSRRTRPSLNRDRKSADRGLGCDRLRKATDRGRGQCRGFPFSVWERLLSASSLWRSSRLVFGLSNGL